MKTFAQLSVAALASYATAASVDVNKRETPLSVQLTATGNSEVKIAVTNNGDKTLNLLSKGTFLDEKTPVEKVSIYSAGGSMYHCDQFTVDVLTSIRCQSPIRGHQASPLDLGSGCR
jgi:hypothetical protein